jgi:Tfp pilus assembly protein PilP
MTEEEKIMKLFTVVHGEISGSCYAEIAYTEEHDVYAVKVLKNGNTCWQANKVDLLFDYITENLTT